MYLNHIAFSLEADQTKMSKSEVVKETATKSVNRIRNSKESLIFEIWVFLWVWPNSVFPCSAECDTINYRQQTSKGV